MRKYLALLITVVMIFTLCACGTNTENTAETAPTADQVSAYSGDWYGYWIMTNPTGEYESQTERFWDCCATIRLEDDGVGCITLIDEDLPEGENLGEIFIKISGDTGNASSINGSFKGNDIAEGQWVFTTSSQIADSMIIITSTYENDNGSFGYTIVLRPWGQIWDDVSEDYLPYYYNSWYLPLIENNEPMPSVMNIP